MGRLRNWIKAESFPPIDIWGHKQGGCRVPARVSSYCPIFAPVWPHMVPQNRSNAYVYDLMVLCFGVFFSFVFFGVICIFFIFCLYFFNFFFCYILGSNKTIVVSCRGQVVGRGEVGWPAKVGSYGSVFHPSRPLAHCQLKFNSEKC